MHWGEYQRLKGTMSGEKEQKGVARWKADTYQLRINIHFKTSLNKTRDFETGGVASILYSIFVSSFYQPLRSMVSFILNQEFFKGGVGGGKALQSFSLYPPPWKRTSWLQDLLYPFLEKGLPDSKIELISPTAIGCQVHNRLRGKRSWTVSYDFFLVQLRGKLLCNVEMY